MPEEDDYNPDAVSEAWTPDPRYTGRGRIETHPEDPEKRVFVVPERVWPEHVAKRRAVEAAMSRDDRRALRAMPPQARRAEINRRVEEGARD